MFRKWEWVYQEPKEHECVLPRANAIRFSKAILRCKKCKVVWMNTLVTYEDGQTEWTWEQVY